MKVLIVDDDDAIVEVIRDAVNWKRLEIYEVYTAHDAECARKILEERNVDIVISDIEMPGESGIELLQWYFEKGYEGKFLLLTSHESFDYATKALKFHASDYLLKPFNVQMMEMILKKNITSLEEERQKEESAEYGQWIRENMKEVKLAFWQSIISGRLQADRKVIEDNVHIRRLDLDVNASYRLVVSKVTNLEQDEEQYGSDLVRFILPDYHSEILCGMNENERVISYDRRGSILIVSICDAESEQTMLDRCKRLIRKCGNMLEATVTCCISKPCKMDNFREVYYRLVNIQEHNVTFCGEAYLEMQVNVEESGNISVLDLTEMKSLLEKRDKKTLLEHLKHELESKIKLHVMSAKMLNIVYLEFQQAVYSYLANRGIQISSLFNDKDSNRIVEKAEQSVIDLIRWANYIVDKAFELEEELHRSQTVIEKINRYIHEHYKEEIGRNEIGAEFHLVPEYVARLYKRKTGQNLKDYINEYRIEQAKILLRTSDMLVSDVSAEVGIDNISYFSTLFRKNTGISPNEYRRQEISHVE